MAEFGDLIVVIPGILGSRLKRSDGTPLYDLTLTGLTRTLWTLTGDGLAHLYRDAPPDDGVVATDLFNFQLLPGFFGNDDYGVLVARLRANVRYPDQQVIKFPYDWRASNRWAAERLNQVVRSALKKWQSCSGNTDAKLWLVCHSMGGLVARYFCEHEDLGGAEITRELITIGTPHRGAVKALEVLVNGMRLAGLVNVSQFVRSLPSAYELLPQFPVLRASDGGRGGPFRLADAYGLGDRLAVPQRTRAAAAAPAPTRFEGLPNLDRTMLERAVDFHAAIRNPVVKRMDEGAPAPYTVRCFLNRRQPTILSALLHSGGLEASTGDPLASPDAPADPSNRGDGTVAAFSAIPIEWDNTSGAVAVSAKHVGMPASVAVLDVLRNWIRPQDARAYMGGGIEDGDVLGLQVPSAIRRGEGLAIEVDALVAANVTVTLESIDADMVPVSVRTRVPASGQPQTIDLGIPAEGSWRVTVTPEDRRRPAVSDYVLVVATG
jgi:pimeloyl-ACP methyl ester carboxylesterase